MPSLPIIYASTSGNVLAVCEKVSTVLTAADIPNTLHRVETTPISVLQEAPVAILATSTWEHGVLNPYFNEFYKAMGELDCHGKQAAFIGLGDTRYEPVLFCKGMEIVRDQFIKQDGTELMGDLKINGEPYGLLDTAVATWAQDLVTKLKSLAGHETV